MLDEYNRTIDYLRVSVTDRCNFRCVYCMPPEGVIPLRHEEILRFEEILRLIRVAARLGVRKVRLTGGEPLVRTGIVSLVKEIAALKVIDDISMTTNGSLLAGMAGDLKAAGLRRVNISLDTPNRRQFAELTGQDQLAATLAGIESALEVGLTPVKINVALTEHFTATDLSYFIDLAVRFPLHVRFIEYMPIGHCAIQPGPSVAWIKERLNSCGQGLLTAANTKAGGSGPARYYRLAGAKGMFGFITPLSEHFCNTCNRIRLTADGKLKPCLLSNQEVDIKTALRTGADDQMLGQLFCQAVRLKPSGHSLCRASGHADFRRQMSQIGG